MSLEAISEIERYLHQRENGLPLSEIKRRCEEFVRERDGTGSEMSRYERHVNGYYGRPCIREGVEIEREKVRA